MCGTEAASLAFLLKLFFLSPGAIGCERVASDEQACMRFRVQWAKLVWGFTLGREGGEWVLDISPANARVPDKTSQPQTFSAQTVSANVHRLDHV